MEFITSITMLSTQINKMESNKNFNCSNKSLEFIEVKNLFCYRILNTINKHFYKGVVGNKIKHISHSTYNSINFYSIQSKSVIASRKKNKV